MKAILLLIALSYCCFSSTQSVDPPFRPATTALPLSVADIPTGPTVAGVFDGRTPCQEIAQALNRPVSSDCFKLKWRLVLYQHPQTRTHTTYRLEGTLYRQRVREGSWTQKTGTKTDSTATVYQLDLNDPNQSVYLMKGDENVLFFLGKDRDLLIGNADFGYTLNRISPKK
ncbi:hypothetical protein GCM10023091_36900 [Ravibacter arvi]|uniref:Copper resistance protein NlpE n=1 Tax=Ravibacter arvi TaxID=2051041 RepID=A0ABP8M8L2_9BACT